MKAMGVAAKKGRGGDVENIDKVRSLREIFRKLDRSGDGTLDLIEMRTFLQKGNPNMTDREVQMLFHACDSDGDGKVDFEEFVAYVFNEECHNRPVVPAPPDVQIVYDNRCTRRNELELSQFMDLCIALEGPGFSRLDADVVFDRLTKKTEKAGESKTMALDEFERSMCLIAERRGLTPDAVYEKLGDTPLGVTFTRRDSSKDTCAKAKAKSMSGTKSLTVAQPPKNGTASVSPRSAASQRPESRQAMGPTASAASRPSSRAQTMGAQVKSAGDAVDAEAYFENVFTTQGGAGELSSQQLVRLCHGILDGKLTASDVENIFAKVCKGSKKMLKTQFKAAIKLMAQRKGVSLDELANAHGWVQPNSSAGDSLNFTASLF